MSKAVEKGKAVVARNKAIKDYEDAINRYNDDGPAEYDWLGDLEFQDLQSLERLQDSELENIRTDPRYSEYEMEALRMLEDQAENGFTSRDEADLARIESQTRRGLRGQTDAIKQNMSARGISGSGMDFISQQQAAQNSAEMQALAGLEKAAMMQERQQSAAARLGSMGTQMKDSDFAKQARMAEAQDAINRFNNQTSNNRTMYNNQGQNQANQQNWAGRQGNSNINTQGQNQFADKRLDNQRDLSSMQFNQATDNKNRIAMEQEAERKRNAGQMGAVIGAGGAVIGGIYGGPMGAGAGYQAGNALGQGIASDKKGKKDIKEENPYDIEEFLQSLDPKSYSYKDEIKERHGIVAQDVARSRIGKDMLREGADGLEIDVNDAVSALFQAVAHVNKKLEGRG